MSDQEAKNAVRDAVEYVLRRKAEHEQNRDWALAYCSHPDIYRLETPTMVKDVCRTCGARRTTYAIPEDLPSLRELVEKAKGTP